MKVKAITIEGENVIIPAREYDQLCYAAQTAQKFVSVVSCALHIFDNFPMEQDPARVIGLVELRKALNDAGYNV